MSEFLAPELQELGLSPFFLQQLHALSSDGVVGRVACERRSEYEIVTARGVLRASLSGRLEHTLGDDDWPTVGDWVVVEPAEPIAQQHERKGQDLDTAKRRTEPQLGGRALNPLPASATLATWPRDPMC